MTQQETNNLNDYTPYLEKLRRSDVVVGRMYPSANQNINDVTVTKINLDSLSFSNRINIDTTNYRMVITSEGYYQISASICYNNPVADKLYTCYIKKNGADVSSARVHSSNTMNLQAIFSDICKCIPGDYIELFAACNAGAGVTVTGNSAFTFLSIHKIYL